MPRDRLDSSGLSPYHIILFLGAHVVLGLILASARDLSTLHAVAVLGLGIWWAATRPLLQTAYVGGYIAGSEVLWRMSKAVVPWEYGKYALSLVFLISLVRNRRIFGPPTILFYLVLLLPSIWLLVGKAEIGEARKLISFNLSGPFTLFAAAWFFSHVRLTARELHKVLLALVGPITSIVTLAIAKIATAEALVIHGDSNPMLSGGYSPNQVAAILSVGIIALFLYVSIGRTEKHVKILLGAGILVFLVQMALTFSRTGLALTVGSVVAACFFLFRSTRSRITILSLGLVVGIFAAYLMIPRIDAFTEGLFTKRFQEFSTTGRADIAASEIAMWQQNPLLGVGPGGGSLNRSLVQGDRVAAHTEYTRMLSEHGMLGLLAIVLLFVMGCRNLLHASGAKARALCAALIVWTLMFLLVSAFRLALPAYLYGLTFATLLLQEQWRMRLRPLTSEAGS